MKIIIAGAGEVGTHLAKLLTKEEQDIVLIDTDEKILREIDSKYNIMTYVGNPTQLEVLEDVGIDGCDLFIAVAPYESLNINACILATNLGAKKTVARVENIGYLNPKSREIFKKVGVDEMIYPEQMAAKEIFASLQHTWSWQLINFSNDLIRLAGIRVRENASILHIPLEKLFLENPFFHIVTIKRGSQTIMPHGSDCVKPGDIIYATYLPKDEEKLKEMCGKETIRVQKVMIMGASEIALLTAKEASASMRVRIVDKDMKRIERLIRKVDNVLFLHSDLRNVDAPQEEEIDQMDAFIALSDSAEENILACKTACDFGVSKTIVEVENLHYIQMAESLDMGTVVNKKIIAASQIYQMLLGHKNIKINCLTYADAEAVEIKVLAGSKVTKQPVRKLSLPPAIKLGGLIRDGVPYLITGDTQIQTNDTVIVFIEGSAISKIDKYFA